jgi:hypothetical protein
MRLYRLRWNARADRLETPRELVFLLSGQKPEISPNASEISPKRVDTYRASLTRELNVHDLAGPSNSRWSEASRALPLGAEPEALRHRSVL